IGNRCLIGMGAIVLDEAVVEDEVIVGAGSVVSPGKVLESGYLWLGVPARKIRPITDRERAYFDYSARFYRELAQRHRRST
ncbi:MAG TPA: gamma carbonic anhydrase family protein, partial [Halothiobacillus sp.]|nr:gamma carbonic anhydrase family protein [Halothiobacillus sp.]